MINLKAILVESGRAFYEDHGVFFHVAPPYTFDALLEVDEYEIDEATSGYGFKVAEGKFNNVAELCDYLMAEYAKWEKANPEPAQEAEMTEVEMLRIMPVAMFEVFVDDLQKSFKAGKYEQVQRLATEMLKNQHADELKVEMTKLRKLIRKCIAERQNKWSDVFVNIAGAVSRKVVSLYEMDKNLRLQVSPIEMVV